MQPSYRLFSLSLLFVLLAHSALFAKDGDRVQIGRSISIGPNEAAGDVVCIGCSIHIEGSCGDVVAVGGSIVVDGDVAGDAVAVGGSLQLNEDATIAGDAVSVGGRVRRHPNATVKGTVSSRSGIPLLIGLVVVPLLPLILIVALIVWLLDRRRRPGPVQPARRM